MISTGHSIHNMSLDRHGYKLEECNRKVVILVNSLFLVSPNSLRCLSQSTHTLKACVCGHQWSADSSRDALFQSNVFLT